MPKYPETAPFMQRLVRDEAGNTLMLAGAALLPLLGMVGGGVDMSRAYLANSRLQQACDAGVLAARKRLGSSAAVDGKIPADVAEVGNRFFNINFQSGAYGTDQRSFVMTLEDDYAITGEAEVDVPTALMNVFGINDVPIAVECEARLSFPNLDLMMAIDVTGSMRHTNAGDSQSRIESVKSVIRNFHKRLEGSKAPGVRLRYGFVPYASNVNVGHLLDDSWVVDDWVYQSRELDSKNTSVGYTTFDKNWQYQSGTVTDWQTLSSFPATYIPGSSGGGGQGDAKGGSTPGRWECQGAKPGDTLSRKDEVLETIKTEVSDPPGTRTVVKKKRTENGTTYNIKRAGETCYIESRSYTDFVNTFETVTKPEYRTSTAFRYAPIARDVRNWRSESNGCMEERATYAITDPLNVDFDQALDLDIDRLPETGDDATKWRPQYPKAIYVRSLDGNGNGKITLSEVVTGSNFADTGNWWFSDCPAPAQKPEEMNPAELDRFLATLKTEGSTYHDIGMLWAARLLSPTGIFSAHNADTTPANPTSRHIIFLTDGQTEPYDIAYGAYGVEALDQRRWTVGSALSLVDTVETRFEVACLEARKRNINVWVIAFGTAINQSMIDCAGNGRYFEAGDADSLEETFGKIADSLGDLRISQ